jgi:hypothetical protein
MVAMKKELAVMLTPCSNGAPGAIRTSALCQKRTFKSV